MRFGIIGTNWITDRLIKAARNLPDFTIGAVYSRTEERGREFASKYGVLAVYTDMQEMFQSGDIDTVYIASPNSFHVEQSILALEHGIPVLCEKPAVISVAEMDQIIEAARKHQTTYKEFEAVVMYSKITDSYLPCEIQGEEGIIEINKISDPKQVVIKYRDGRTEDLSVKQEFDTMYYELKEFMDCAAAKQVESAVNTHETSRQVIKILNS